MAAAKKRKKQSSAKARKAPQAKPLPKKKRGAVKKKAAPRKTKGAKATAVVPRRRRVQVSEKAPSKAARARSSPPRFRARAASGGAAKKKAKGRKPPKKKPVAAKKVTAANKKRRHDAAIRGHETRQIRDARRAMASVDNLDGKREHDRMVLRRMIDNGDIRWHRFRQLAEDLGRSLRDAKNEWFSPKARRK